MSWEVDFETGKDEEGVWVYLWDACEIAEDFSHTYGESIAEWWEWAQEQKEMYFHNLAFDGSYIICYLESIGFTHIDGEEARQKTYTTAISGQGKWFFIEVMCKDGHILTIKDSLKKIPLPVRDIPKAYGIETQKGSIDYKVTDRNKIVTYSDWIYCAKDTEIVARAMKQHFDAGMTKLTLPSDALCNMKKTMDYRSITANDWWLKHPQADKECRLAYSGGISWVNPKIQGEVVANGEVYDCNSMYPHVMLHRGYPIGIPWEFNMNVEGDHHIALYHIVDLELKLGHAACIRDPSARKWIDYLYSGDIWLTSVDIETLKEHYNYDILIPLRGYAWKNGDDIFKEFIGDCMQRKEKETGGKRTIAKLEANSSYGKLGTNPLVTTKTPRLEEGVIKWTGGSRDGAPQCVALAAFVTAYARQEWSRVASMSKGFCYGDTDSVHLAEIDNKSCKFLGADIDSKRTGAWKKESKFLAAKFLRQKTYIEEDINGKLTITACGCPPETKKYITFANFEIGNKFPGKLRQQQMKGGVALVETEFTIRAPVEWGRK